MVSLVMSPNHSFLESYTEAIVFVRAILGEFAMTWDSLCVHSSISQNITVPSLKEVAKTEPF